MKIVAMLRDVLVWLWWKAILPGWLWTCTQFRAIIQAWLLFGLCFVLLEAWPYWLMLASAFLESLLNAVAPRPEPWELFWTIKGQPGSQPSLTEAMVGKLPLVLFWYFAVVFPIFLLYRNRSYVDALGPYDARTMENMVRLLRARALTFKCWAGCAVVLIIGSLWVGVTLFASDSYVAPAGEKGPQGRITIEFKEDTNTLIGRTTRRVGALIILVFLVTVLVHMYRDNIKQSTFYDRWADAFQLAGTNPDELKKYIDLFFLGWLEYDKPPSSPVEQIAQALRGVQNQLGKLK